MRIGITGGTGFVGGHLAQRLAAEGHQVALVSRGVDQRPAARRISDLPGVEVVRASITQRRDLASAFNGCDAVAHCAGINREIGSQTYDAIHVHGTANVVGAAEEAGVRRLALMSFLRARPACGSAYHESKWAAEEIVRASSLQWTVLKPGMVYGSGDHFLDHLSHALFTFPIYVGIGSRRIRPLWIDDLVDVLIAALIEGRLERQTVPVIGPSEIGFDDAVRTIAAVIERRVLVVRLPIHFHRALAWITEKTMTIPLVARAQVRMLEEEIVEPVLAPDRLPEDLEPRSAFEADTIRRGLPERGGFKLKDLRWVTDPTKSVR